MLVSFKCILLNGMSAWLFMDKLCLYRWYNGFYLSFIYLFIFPTMSFIGNSNTCHGQFSEIWYILCSLEIHSVNSKVFKWISFDYREYFREIFAALSKVPLK